jgi:hypothetical protein
MIPVHLTCESEDIPAAERTEGALAHMPVIRLNGDPLWRGRPERSAADAERVALAYLRYVLGGALGDPGAAETRFTPPEEEPPKAKPTGDAVGEAVEALGTELLGAIRRVSEFLEKGDWRRFLR